jgi:hypothetical protein
MALQRHRSLGFVVADAEIPRHVAQRDPLHGEGPRRALGRQFFDRIAEAVDQIGLPARALRHRRAVCGGPFHGNEPVTDIPNLATVGGKQGERATPTGGPEMPVMAEKSSDTSELSFEFVGDQELRAALARDAKELSFASDAGAYKSTVVLAGSIIETVLLDHLVSTDHNKRTGDDPTKFEFRKLIETCHSEGVISDRTKQLLHAVRDYRNLIHPGRSLRLKEQVTSAAATIAKSVVSLVCTEMAERPNRSFGMTAEQVLAKVVHDPMIVKMIDRILPELRSSELERLVLKTIPEAYLDEPYDPEDIESMGALYASAFERCDDATKAARISNICQAIQNDPGWKVRTQLAHTFVGWHFQYAPKDKQRLIVDRLLVESRGAKIPFSTVTYQYILNVLPSIDIAMDFALELFSYMQWWPETERKSISRVVLTDPKWGHYPPLNKEAAATHYADLVSRFRARQERPRAGGVDDDPVREWMKDVIEASEFPF